MKSGFTLVIAPCFNPRNMVKKRNVRIWISPLLCVVGFAFMPMVQASANQTCSTTMSRRAESTLNDARGRWSRLLEHQKAFARCDDGALGEAYSDAVVSLFARHWDQFHEFAAIAERNPEFQRWALRHIDASASDDDLRLIVSNTSSCKNGTPYCTSIQMAARNALAESINSSSSTKIQRLR